MAIISKLGEVMREGCVLLPVVSTCIGYNLLLFCEVHDRLKRSEL